MARWNERLCIRVLGLSPVQAGMLQDQIAAVARQVRLPVATGRCRGNLVVAVTDEAAAFAAAVTYCYPLMFTQPENVRATEAARAAFRRDRPVRALLRARTVGGDGAPLQGGVGLGWRGSRLQEATQEATDGVLLVVDANRLHGVTWGELGAYLAMTGLTRADLGAAYDRSTILGLFQARDQGLAPPQALTRSDRAFLAGLYSGSGAKTVADQRRAVARRVAKATDGPAAP